MRTGSGRLPPLGATTIALEDPLRHKRECPGVIDSQAGIDHDWPAPHRPCLRLLGASHGSYHRASVDLPIPDLGVPGALTRVKAGQCSFVQAISQKASS